MTYRHECKACQFIKTNRCEGHTVDWYFCPSDRAIGGTILGRIGNDPASYWSMPIGVIKTASPIEDGFLSNAVEIVKSLETDKLKTVLDTIGD